VDKDRRIVVLNCEDYNNIMIKELQQFEKMDMPVNGCDAYLTNSEKVVTNLLLNSMVWVQLVMNCCYTQQE